MRRRMTDKRVAFLIANVILLVFVVLFRVEVVCCSDDPAADAPVVDKTV